jgi:hypothetical protein
MICTLGQIWKWLGQNGVGGGQWMTGTLGQNCDGCWQMGPMFVSGGHASGRTET